MTLYVFIHKLILFMYLFKQLLLKMYLSKLK